MLDVHEAEGRAAALIDAALKAGADAADVLYIGDASTEVQVRLGELEDVTRSEGEEIGLRFFVGQRSASVSSSDLSADALAALVERAAAMAREAPEIPSRASRPRTGCCAAPRPISRPTTAPIPRRSRSRRRRWRSRRPRAPCPESPIREGAGVSAGRTRRRARHQPGLCARLYDQRL